jgi:hypothetical protein
MGTVAAILGVIIFILAIMLKNLLYVVNRLSAECTRLKIELDKAKRNE